MSAALSSKLRAATIARALPIAADAAVQRVAPTIRPEETGTVIIVRDLDSEIDLVTVVPHAAWMRAVRRGGLPQSFALRPHDGTRCVFVIEGQTHEARVHGTASPTLATVHALASHPRYRPPAPSEPPAAAPTC